MSQQSMEKGDTAGRTDMTDTKIHVPWLESREKKKRENTHTGEASSLDGVIRRGCWKEAHHLYSESKKK